MSALDDLTPAQKASLGSGASFWRTKAVGAIPAVYLTDGPHGLRAQKEEGLFGLGASIPATCFPPAVGLSQTWSPDLAGRIGAAIGREARAAGVGVVLGPGVNLKRDPRGGRSFEYFSEDPVLTAELATGWVRGIQGEGVGASVKHLVANESEDDRMRADSDVDERTLRELYLRPFQRIVLDARPWTVMCSYNRVNGVYASQNRWLLTDVLRDEWGFDGLVVSDWGAVADRVAAVAAGLDLQMPGPDDGADADVATALQSGALEPAPVDRSAAAVAQLADRVGAAAPAEPWDADAHHELAREAARRAIVLLQNDDGVLPLRPGQRIAVVGEFAERPRFQGGGSSHVTPTRMDVPLEELRDRIDGEVTYARGFAIAPEKDENADAAGLRAEAVRAASGADVAVLFLGLGDRQESEGFDRTSIDLPADQLELLAAVAAAQPEVVVVLSHGGALRLGPVVARAHAIVDGALLGQGGGAALADILTGAVNPSGKLTETSPVRLEDAPAFTDFPAEHSRIRYGEGLFIGYRWYDARDLPVVFPFGHGLSYTTFAYDELTAAAHADGIDVSVRITNTGDRAGREVVQFYVSVPGSRVRRPLRELKAFGDATLDPGASATVTARIGRDDLAYWDTRVHRFVVEPGEYRVTAAASSRDLRATASVELPGEDVRVPLTADSTLAEVLANPAAAAILAPMLEQDADADTDDALGTDLLQMLGSFPIGRMAQFGADAEVLGEILTAGNADPAIPAG